MLWDTLGELYLCPPKVFDLGGGKLVKFVVFVCDYHCADIGRVAILYQLLYYTLTVAYE